MTFLIRFFFLTLISIHASANISATRIEEIRLKVQTIEQDYRYNKISIDYELKLPSPAGAFQAEDGTFRLTINTEIFNTLSNAAQDFIRFHEYGYIYLGHTQMSSTEKDKIRPQIELEADYFAAFMILRYSEVSQELFDFINFIEQMSHTNPSGSIRAEAIRSVLNGSY